MKITDEQLALVNGRIQALLRSNSFYGKKLEDAGVSAVHSPEEFEKLPFSEKKDLRDAYPLGLMTAPEEEIVRIHSSSGTTGTPVIIPYTAKDVDDWAIQFKRCYEMAGIRSVSYVVENTALNASMPTQRWKQAAVFCPSRRCIFTFFTRSPADWWMWVKRLTRRPG